MSRRNDTASNALPGYSGSRRTGSRLGWVTFLMAAVPLLHGRPLPPDGAESQGSHDMAHEDVHGLAPDAGAKPHSIRWAFEEAMASDADRGERGHFAALTSLARHPHAWPVLTDLVRERMRVADLGESVRLRLLDLSSMAPREYGRPLGYALWTAFESSFDLEHLLAFADRGVKPCEQALRERVETRSRTLDLRELRPAAFLASHGDPSGRNLLERAWDRTDLECGSIAQAMVTALALECLGRPSALAEMRQRVSRSAIRLLEAGAVARARVLALESEAFRRFLVSGNRVATDLAWLDQKLQGHRRAVGEDGKGAEPVFDLILSVTPM